MNQTARRAVAAFFLMGLSWEFAMLASLTLSDPAASLPAHLSLSLNPRLLGGGGVVEGGEGVGDVAVPGPVGGEVEGGGA